MKSILPVIGANLIGIFGGVLIGTAVRLPDPAPPTTVTLRAALGQPETCTDQRALHIIRTMTDAKRWHPVLSDNDWLVSQTNDVTIYRPTFGELQFGTADTRVTDLHAPDWPPVCRWQVSTAYAKLARQLSKF